MPFKEASVDLYEIIDYAFGEKRLIASIILLAIGDSLNYKNPRKYHILKPIKKKLTEPKERLASEAREFINEDNKLFQAYCKVLEIDHIKLYEESWKLIKLSDAGKKISVRLMKKMFGMDKEEDRQLLV